MARKKGFESKSGSKVRFNYGKTFDQEVLAAKKKAGGKIGKAIVKERIAGLIAENKTRIGGGIRNNVSRSFRKNQIRGSGAISARRKKAVRSIVGRDGTLVVLDHAPMAVIQETGGIIKSKGKLLKVQDKRRRARGMGKDTYVTKGGLVFEKAKYKKWRRGPDGKRVGMKPKQPKPRLVAVLKQEVVVPQLPEPARLSNIADKHLKDFRDLFSEYLINGVK